jgi:ADP-ribose pyrophosphatase YjhB (NUDIX family)
MRTLSYNIKMLNIIQEMIEPTEKEYAGVLIQVGKKFLLCKRSPTAGKYPNIWSIPSGHVDPGERTKPAAIRELEEETQIKIKDCTLATIARDVGRKNGEAGNMFIYHKILPQEVTPVIDQEHSDWGYFTKNDLPSPMWDAISQLVISLS